MYDQMFLIYDQMYPFFDKIFSNSHCRLRKGFNAEQCLIRMIENQRKYLDNGGDGTAFLTDISKAFYGSSTVDCKTKCLWC